MKKLPAALSTNVYTLLLLLSFAFVGLSLATPISAEQKAVEPASEKVSLEDPDNFETPPRAFYYDVPDDYNMDSCEKVVANNGHEDIIESKIPVQHCVNGKSSGNSALNCTKNWQVAYAEVVSVQNFPLLNFFSATQPTDEHQVMPPCMRDISYNVTNSFKSYIPINFSYDYNGLLAFSGNKEANISYPRLGTASACAGIDSHDVMGTLLLDIQGFNEKLPLLVSKNSSKALNRVGDDTIWTKLISAIKNSTLFKESLKEKANRQIKTVQSELEKIGIKNKKMVCATVPGTPVTKINVSDPITPDEATDTFVTNRNDEIKQYDHTELCDLQYKSGKVIDAGCRMTSGEVFNKSAGTSLVSGGYPGVVRTLTGYDDNNQPQYDCKYPNICGASFDCGDSYATAYNHCRSSATVAEAWGLPTPQYLLSEKGYDTLTIPNGNKLIASTVNNSEQKNAPYGIKYGENIGIRLDAERQIYDLNRFRTLTGANLTGNLPYNPDNKKAKDYDPQTVNSDFAGAISYKLTEYNYVFKDEYENNFKPVANEPVKTQYYFPYLGKIPQMIERMGVIFSNSTDREPTCTISGNCDQKVLGTSTDNVNAPAVEGLFNWRSEIPASVVDPQLKFCAELTAAEQKVNDCYVDKGNPRLDDPVKKYLCEYNLEINCGIQQCIEPPSTDPVSDGSGEVVVDGGNCSLGSVEGKVGWPAEKSKVLDFTTREDDPSTPLVKETPHYVGWDLASIGGANVPVYAVADGTVIFSRDESEGNCPGFNPPCKNFFSETIDKYNKWSAGYGNVVGILHKDGISVYAHMQVGSIKVKVGDCVKAGTQIGNIGSTGNSSGPHLHFELRKLLCIGYTNACNIRSSITTTFADLFEGDSPTGGTDTPIKDGGSVSPYCDETVSVSDPTNPVAPAENIACLIKNAVDFINERNGGYYVSPEAVYATLAGESINFLCDNSSHKQCNSGDPNQKSKLIPYPCYYYPAGCAESSDDGIGISQATYGWYNENIMPNQDLMYACLDFLGVNYKNPEPDTYDKGLANKDFSRIRNGDSICATAIGLALRGKAVGFSEADRFNFDKNLALSEWYTCPGEGWCDRANNYVPYLNKVLGDKRMDQCGSNSEETQL